jgi:hypothetical protein
VWLSVSLLPVLMVGIVVVSGVVGGISYGDRRGVGCVEICICGGGWARLGSLGRSAQFGGRGFSNEYCA